MSQDNTKTRLDANQVIKRVYDRDTESLRTLSTVGIGDITVDIDLDADQDSVSIGNPDNSNTLDINADGSINVNVLNGTGVVTRSTYAEISGLTTGVTGTVLSYTAQPNQKLQKIEFSGTNIAEYELVINGVTQDKKRTYFGQSLNGCFVFDDGINLVASQPVVIYVVHNRPSMGDFNARIQILETT
jgi:hypothetical protein